jgi:hypothetical protein
MWGDEVALPSLFSQGKRKFVGVEVSRMAETLNPSILPAHARLPAPFDEETSQQSSVSTRTAVACHMSTATTCTPTLMGGIDTSAGAYRRYGLRFQKKQILAISM